MSAAAGGHVEVRQGVYHDSVTLMSVSRAVGAVAGVAAAQVAMATPLNLDVLSTMGFALPPVDPDDLVVAIRLDDDLDAAARDAVLRRALDGVDAALAPREPTAPGEQAPPRTTGSALRRSPDALVLVSVAGRHAAVEAWDALDAGAHVMVFSDNVDVQDEVALKDAAVERGLLVMGPDCGTAVVSGVGLGFANVVRPGPVDIVAASGTGAQHLMSLLDAADVGVRHCLGVGGRDLGALVGGRGAEQALRLLAAGAGETSPAAARRLVVLVSKPADPAVVERLDATARDLGLDLVWALLGPDHPDLTRTVETLLAGLGRAVPAWPSWPAVQQLPPPTGASSSTGALVRGLFAGGTLCDEAMTVLTPTLGPIASNVPLTDGAPRLDAATPSALTTALAAAGHAVVDLGDDALTVGRAHPMIDPSLRLDAVAAAAADRRVAVLLLDVVLGHGAHPDPASVHAPAVREAIAAAAAGGRRLDVVVSLVGTRDDPQGLQDQARRLADAGCHVHLSNAAAARAAGALAGGERR